MYKFSTDKRHFLPIIAWMKKERLHLRNCCAAGGIFFHPDGYNSLWGSIFIQTAVSVDIRPVVFKDHQVFIFRKIGWLALWLECNGNIWETRNGNIWETQTLARYESDHTVRGVLMEKITFSVGEKSFCFALCWVFTLVSSIILYVTPHYVL